MPQVSIVCEGETDYVAIGAIMDALIGEHVATLVQPEKSDTFQGAGELGEGWKGVRAWCNQCRDDYGGLSRRMAQAPLSRCAALVVHVDADIAPHEEVACEEPCPPAQATVDRLREVVLDWGGEGTTPDRGVLCVPSKATEAWVLVALHPEHRFATPDIECREQPEALLIGKPEKLVRRESGRLKKGYKKSTAGYKRIARRLTAAWSYVRATCNQAERFSEELVQAVAGPPAP